MALEIVPLADGEKSGAEALRSGVRVAHLLGRLGEAPSRGAYAWVALADQSLSPDETPALLADVYAVAAEPWVERGHLTHIVETSPADDVLRLWFELGFGLEQVYAASPSRAKDPPPPDGYAVRQATTADLERVLDVADAIPRHQIGPPVWSGLPLPTREEMATGWAELLAENGAVVLLAERDGETVGYVATYPADTPGVAHLPVAGTREDARGHGIGSSLAAHALHRAYRDGYATVELDWRSTNLLASRFWRRLGFSPTGYRLRRDVQPYA